MSRIDEDEHMSQIGSEVEEGMEWTQELPDSSGITNWAFPIAPGMPHPTGVAQRRPWPMGQFKTRAVKPILPFLTTLYLRARLIHQLARNVHVFHMQSIYIARQALHLVILLNDAVDESEGPSDEQDDERNDLEDDLIELSKAMTEWGSDKGDDFEYESQATEIEHQYAQLFKERFYFYDARDFSTDPVYQRFVAYDAKTIRYRQRRETYITSPTTIKIECWTEFVEDESGSEDDTGRFDPNIGSLPATLGQGAVEGPPVSELYASVTAFRPGGDAQLAWLAGSEYLARKPLRLAPKSRSMIKKDHPRKRNRAVTAFRIHLVVTRLHVVQIRARKLVRRDTRRWRVLSPPSRSMSLTPPASSASMLLTSPTTTPKIAVVSLSSPPIPEILLVSSPSMQTDAHSASLHPLPENPSESAGPQGVLLPTLEEGGKARELIGNMTIWGEPEPIDAYTTTHLGDLEVAERVHHCADTIIHGDGFTTSEQLIHSDGTKALSPAMPLLAPHYVERSEAMAVVENALFDQDRLIKPGSKIVVVTGLRGCGKTQLIRKFVEQHGNKYTTAFFIDGSSEGAFQRGLVRHVQSLGTAHSRRTFGDSMIFISQSIPRGERILIIDNVDDPSIDLVPFLPRWLNGTVIVTSRDRSRGISASVHLELEVMSQEESVELLIRGWGGAWPASEQDTEDAVAVAKELGCHPIALVQAISYISNTGYSAQTYITRLRTYREPVLKNPATNQGDMRYKTAFAAFDAAYGILSPRGQDALHLLSFFHWQNFSLELVSMAAENDFSTDEFNYIRHGEDFEGAKRLLTTIFSPSGQWTPLALDPLITSLRNHSFVTVVSNGKVTLLRMHPLVHEWARIRLPMDSFESFQNAAIRLLCCGATRDNHSMMKYLYPHVQALRSAWDGLHPSDAMSFAFILRESGLYGEAAELLKKAHEILKARLGVDHLQTIAVSSNPAATYHELGRYDEADESEKEVLRRRREILGVDHPDTIRASANLAATYRQLGRYGEAKDLLCGRVLQSQLRRAITLTLSLRRKQFYPASFEAESRVDGDKADGGWRTDGRTDGRISKWVEMIFEAFRSE